MLFTSLKWRQFSTPLLSLRQEIKSNAQYGLRNVGLNWLYTGRIVNFSSSENPLWVKLSVLFFSYLCEFHCGNYALKPPGPAGTWRMTCAGSNAELGEAASEQYSNPPTQKESCPCASCSNERLPPLNSAAGDSSSCKFSFNLTSPQTLCPRKVDCQPLKGSSSESVGYMLSF